MTTFETEEELRREKKAIELFVKIFNGSYKKLDPNDVDYKVFDNNNNLIAYAEVSKKFGSMSNAYPLQIPANKVVKLTEKRLPPVLIWACDDGIIYTVATNVKGQIKAMDKHNLDLTVLYDKQRGFKYIRFT
jgi:hypothetical protein